MTCHRSTLRVSPATLLNQDLERFMVERNISTEAQEAAADRDDVNIYKAMISPINGRFERSNIDIISAMSVRQNRICTERELTMVWRAAEFSPENNRLSALKNNHHLVGFLHLELIYHERKIQWWTDPTGTLIYFPAKRLRIFLFTQHISLFVIVTSLRSHFPSTLNNLVGTCHRWALIQNSIINIFSSYKHTLTVLRYMSRTRNSHKLWDSTWKDVVGRVEASEYIETYSHAGIISANHGYIVVGL